MEKIIFYFFVIIGIYGIVFRKKVAKRWLKSQRRMGLQLPDEFQFPMEIFGTFLALVFTAIGLYKLFISP